MKKGVTFIMLALALSAILPPAALAGDEIGPLCFEFVRNARRDAVEIFVRISDTSNLVSMRGRQKFFNDAPADQAVFGSGVIAGNNLVWGIEQFPTGDLPVAAKLGGVLNLGNLQGDGTGYHLTPTAVFFFLFALSVFFGPCGSVAPA